MLLVLVLVMTVVVVPSLVVLFLLDRAEPRTRRASYSRPITPDELRRVGGAGIGTSPSSPAPLVAPEKP